MKVLVVGGAGYVGCVLVKELLKNNFEVKVFDNMFYSEIGLEEVKDRIELEIGDINRINSATLNSIDCVINLGAVADEKTARYTPQKSYEINTKGTEYLAKICKKKGIKRFIFASTCSVYDFGVTSEEKDVLQDETSPVTPKSLYAISKYKAERILLSMKDDNFSPIILRKATIYGFSPRMRYDLVVNTFVKDALSKGYITLHYGGEMWRPLVEVRDVAKVYIKLLQAKNLNSSLYNVVYSNFRISELALRIVEVLKEMNINVEIRPDYKYRKVRSYRVSGKRLQKELGIRLTISVEDSVRDMIKNIRRSHFDNFNNPKYYNIEWWKLKRSNM